MKRNLYFWMSVAMMIIAGAAQLVLWRYSPLAVAPGLTVAYIFTFMVRITISVFLMVMFVYGLQALLFTHLYIHKRMMCGIRTLWSHVFNRSAPVVK